MGNEFVSHQERGVGTSATPVYTAGAGVSAVVIGMTIANVLGSSTSCHVQMYDGTNYTDIVAEGTPLPAGSSLICAGGEQKIVVPDGYSLAVTMADSASSDVNLSILEMT